MAPPAAPQAPPENLRTELHQLARRQSAEYIAANMGTVPSVDDDFKVHDIAISAARQNGLVLEFGVFGGRSIQHIAASRNWTVDGFDSFEGLPEFWRDGFEKGHFALQELPQVHSNVRLHKGWFDETIEPFLDAYAKADETIAYLHIDCDLYSSTATIFSQLGHLIKTGTVIVFDEYLNYPGWKDGEWKAFQEFIAARKLNYRYLTYNYMHEQVAVIIE